MIKDNQKYFNRLQVAIDAGVTAVSYVAAWGIQFTFLTPRSEGRLPVSTYMLALIFVIPAYLLLYDGFRLYKPKRISGRRVEAGNIFLSNMVGLLGFIFVLYVIREQNFSRQMLFLFTGINFVGLVIERNFIRIVLHRIRRKGMNLKHMMLVGCSKAAEGYIERIAQNPQWGYQVHGILDVNTPVGTS